MVDGAWTPRLVEDRIEEAAHTLRRLPAVRVPIARSSWPQYIREFHDAYGAEPERLRLGPPSAAAIDRMDETLVWLQWLDPDDGRIVWLRACGVRWRVIGFRFGVCRQTAWKRWVFALATIADKLKRRTVLNGKVVTGRDKK